MSTDFAQFVDKFQTDTLQAVKQAQDVNLAAFEQARELFTELSKVEKLPTVQDLPTPTKFVELSFDYAGKFLELRKQYALQVAELFTEATKNITNVTSTN
jgi:hypothetical protein